MPTFPSKEWPDEYVNRINGSAEYREAAATWEGDIAYVFEAEPDKGGRAVKALVFEDVQSVSVSEVPDPRIEDPHDAVVRVTAAGICGTDLHFYNGKAPLSPGDTIGHEGVGVVEEVGPGVRRFRPGHR